MPSPPPHPLRQAVHTALKQYDDVALLERNTLTTLYALWPLPADHWHDSLAAPRRGIALRRLIDRALERLAARLPAEHALLVEKYLHKIPTSTLKNTYTMSKAEVYRDLNAAMDALATEIAMLDAGAAPLVQQRLATQTAFLPGFATDTIVGLDALLDTFLGHLRQRLRQNRTPILITGLGGIGKTTLIDTGLRLWLQQESPAVAGCLYVRVANGDRSRTRTPEESLNAILLQLSVQLDKPLLDPNTPGMGLARLVSHLAAQQREGEERFIIILDDIESEAEHEAGVQFAQAVGGVAIVILASRQNPEHPTMRGSVVEVRELDKRASAKLVRTLRTTTDPDLAPLSAPEVRRIVTTVGGHPLALRLVVAQVGRGRLTLNQVLAGLRRTETFTKQLYDHIYERSWALLSPLACQVLAWFTNYPTAGVTREALNSLKTMVGEGASWRTVERAVGELMVLNLLQRTTRPQEGFALHRLTYEFVEYKTNRRPLAYDDVEISLDHRDDDDAESPFFQDE
jgi:hypothetical protein